MYTLTIIAALVISLISGGDIRRLMSLDIKRLPWLFASLVIPLVVEASSGAGSNSAAVIGAAGTILSYAALFYGMAANLHIPGIYAVALGSLANFVVIAANSFRMPVRLDFFEAGVFAQEAARLAESSTHAALDLSTRFPFLADVIPWNYFVSRPSMVSVGDVIIAAGVGWLIIRTARPRFFR